MRHGWITAGLLGVLLLAGTPAYAQDATAEAKLQDEIWEARAKKNTETVQTKTDELKQLNPKNAAISVHESWLKSVQANGGHAETDGLQKPADWVAKIQPTPIPTPRPTPVPEPIVFDQPENSFTGKTIFYSEKSMKWFMDQELYIQGGIGVAILVILGLLGKLIFRRRKEEDLEPITTGLPKPAGLGGGLGLAHASPGPIAPPSFDPLGGDVMPGLAPQAPALDKAPATAPSTASMEEIHPASAKATMAPAGSMSDSTVNLLRSFGENMDSFSNDPKTDLPGQDDPNSEFNLDALFASTPSTPSIAPAPAPKPADSMADLNALFASAPETPAVTPEPTPTPAPKSATSMPDLTALFAEQESTPTPAPAPAPKPAASSDLDLTALFAEDPFGDGSDAPTAPTSDDGGNAFYQDQMTKAKNAIAEGRFADAANFLSIVTSLNPDDAEAEKLLAEAKSKM